VITIFRDHGTLSQVNGTERRVTVTLNSSNFKSNFKSNLIQI